jgi:hypothetical protein
LTVNVQDFFLWPLGAVLIGEGLAFGVAYWRDQRRARKILEIALGKAKQEFDLAVSTGELTERERSWFDGIFEPAGISRADRTLTDIRKASSKDDLDSAATDAAEIVAIWESLPNLRKAVAGLIEQLEENRHIDPQAAVFAHAIELLAHRETGFATSADAKSYGVDLGDQTAAINDVKRAFAELDRGETMWAQLAESARAVLFRENPLAYWDEAVRPLRTKQELIDDEVLQELRDRNVAILGYLLAHPAGMSDEADDRPEVGRFRNYIQTYAAAPSAGGIDGLTLENLFPSTSEPIAPPVIWQDPHLLLVRVRSFDLVEFWLSFALGLVTTFLLLYQDKNFGTSWQYIGAVATGFAATTAVLQLLPWYRSYKPAAAAAASPS